MSKKNLVQLSKGIRISYNINYYQSIVDNIKYDKDAIILYKVPEYFTKVINIRVTGKGTFKTQIFYSDET